MRNDTLKIRRIFATTGLISIVALFCILAVPPPTSAATIDELKGKIDGHNDRITELEKEIAAFEAQIATTGKQAKSLQSEIARLNAERQKLLKEITLTENQIKSVGYTLDQLEIEINDKITKIHLNTDAIAESIRNMHEQESRSLMEVMLTNESIGEALSHIDTIEQYNNGIREKLQLLRSLKSDLENKKSENETKKRELENLKGRIGDQKKITEINKSEKDRLLSVTKSQEAKYKEALAERKRLKDQFEKELFDLESQLKIAIDPSSIPAPGTKVLSWPLASITVTQHFGETDFSRANPGVYSGRGHNGVDFRASSNTAVLAAASGVIEGTGNTDVGRCESYGKWVLIKHGNGLSTLYAHLNLIKVTAGQQVNVGDTIGYSGNTGYSTGPHLHFGVYATQGVRIERFEKSINCKNVDIPIAALNAYLNPLSYLGDL